jgi:tetratricopeptide (TPR) repeat protein
VLLDRQRTKFWQRIVFSLMAVLMVAWLVGLAVSQLVCGRNTTSANGLDSRVKAATAAVDADPTDPAALLAAAIAYRDRAGSGIDQNSSADEQAKQRADLAQALTYYTRYVALKDKALGVDAKQRRIDAYSQMARVQAALGDYKGAVTSLVALTDLEPKNAQTYLDLGLAARSAGDGRTEYFALTRYLELDPSSSIASDVKQRIKAVKAQLESSSKASPAPTPSGGN